MKLLAEISDRSLGLSTAGEQPGQHYELRKSARAILLNREGKIAVQHLSNYTFYKLPGGGVEVGEEIEDALKREVREEIGCDCIVVRSVGMVIEYQGSSRLLQISFCYIAEVVGEIGDTQLEEGEIEEGQETLWLTPEDVLERMRKDIPRKEQGRFILKREISFLEEYLRIR